MSAPLPRWHTLDACHEHGHSGAQLELCATRRRVAEEIVDVYRLHYLGGWRRPREARDELVALRYIMGGEYLWWSKGFAPVAVGV